MNMNEIRLSTDAKFHAIFEASIDAIFIETIEGVIVDCNPQACQMYGYSKAEMLNLGVADLLPRHLADKVSLFESKIRANGRFFMIAEGKRKNGEIFPTEVSTHIMEYHGQMMVVVYVRDISERLKVQKKLEENQRMMLTLLSNLPGIAYRCFNDKDWTMEFISEGCLELTGYVHSDLLRNQVVSYGDLIHPDDSQLVWDSVQEAIQKKSSFKLEYRIKCRDGSVKWVWEQGRGVFDSKGHLQAIEGFITDINERHTAEEELNQYAQKLNILNQIQQDMMSEYSPVGIAQKVVDHLSRLLKAGFVSILTYNFYTNEKFVLAANQDSGSRIRQGSRWPLTRKELALHQVDTYQMTDLKSLKILTPFQKQLTRDGYDCYSVIPIVYKEELIGSLNLAYASCDIPVKDDLEFACKVAVPMAIVFQHAKLYEKVQNYATDLERRVVERTSRLQEVNEELESFSYSVSHDLRSPLRSIQGFSRALQEDYGQRIDPEGLDYIRRIESASIRMEQLINDLLEYSRLSRSDLVLEQVSLSRVVSEALLQLEIEITRRNAIIEVIRPMHHILGHPSTVFQVILNLISNAIKFTMRDVVPSVKLWSEQRNQYIRFWVEDNGIGISAEDHDRIFRIFERLNRDPDFPGTGIGLAIVRKSIERMGGRVGLISAPGQGSKFWFELFSSGSEGNQDTTPKE